VTVASVNFVLLAHAPGSAETSTEAVSGDTGATVDGPGVMVIV
jgi:hypothetical protein